MTDRIEICQIDDIPEGKSKGFNVADRAVFVVKKNGSCYAYQNACPHLGVELEWTEDEFLDPDGELIQCHLHGALFNIEDGACISGPCEGDHLTLCQTAIENNRLYLIGKAK